FSTSIVRKTEALSGLNRRVRTVCRTLRSMDTSSTRVTSPNVVVLGRNNGCEARCRRFQITRLTLSRDSKAKQFLISTLSLKNTQERNRRCSSTRKLRKQNLISLSSKAGSELLKR